MYLNRIHNMYKHLLCFLAYVDVAWQFDTGGGGRTPRSQIYKNDSGLWYLNAFQQVFIQLKPPAV